MPTAWPAKTVLKLIFSLRNSSGSSTRAQKCYPCLRYVHVSGPDLFQIVEPMGFESTSELETKEFCGAAWPSMELKRKERNSYCPLIAPKKSVVRKCLLERGGREFLPPRLIRTVN
jgi:hypothetical protein